MKLIGTAKLTQFYLEVVSRTQRGEGEISKTAVLSVSKIYLNGEEVYLTAYNIDGNNYFKLREIGEVLNFGVDWDDEVNTIIIDTSINYTPEST